MVDWDLEIYITSTGRFLLTQFGNWCNDPIVWHIEFLKANVDPTLLVFQFINQGIKEWNKDKLDEVIETEEVEAIKQIYLPKSAASDTYMWAYTNNGRYTVKSGYRLAVSEASSNPNTFPPLKQAPDLAKCIWDIHTMPKLRHFCMESSVGSFSYQNKLTKERFECKSVVWTMLFRTLVWLFQAIHQQPPNLRLDKYLDTIRQWKQSNRCFIMWSSDLQREKAIGVQTVLQKRA